MTAAAEDRNENRRDPFSEAFKTFIVSDWEPYSDQLPERLASAPYAAARRAELTKLYPGTTLIIPAGPLKTRSNDTDYRFRPHSAFAYYTGLGEDREPDSVLVLKDDTATLFFPTPRPAHRP